MTLTKSFEARKRIFSGRRWIQLCWPGFFSVAGVAAPRDRRIALTLSTSISPPTEPSSTT